MENFRFADSTADFDRILSRKPCRDLAKLHKVILNLLAQPLSRRSLTLLRREFSGKRALRSLPHR